MKKIGIVSIWPLNSSAFAGTEKFVLRLARAFKRDGHTVTCYSPSSDSNYREFRNIFLDIPGFNTVDEVLLKASMEKYGVAKVVKNVSESLNRLIKDSDNDFWVLNSPFFSMVQSSSKIIISSRRLMNSGANVCLTFDITCSSIRSREASAVA